MSNPFSGTAIAKNMFFQDAVRALQEHSKFLNLKTLV